MNDMRDEFTRIVEELTNKSKHIGLYLIGSTLATDSDELFGDDDDMLDKNPDVKEMIDRGEASFAIMAQFTIGDIAFDARVQAPTQHEMDMEFRQMMPSEAELTRDAIQEKLESIQSDDDLLNAFFDGPVEDGDDASGGS